MKSMLSRKTLLEIIYIIEDWAGAEVDRVASTFCIEIPPGQEGKELSRAKKANVILKELQQNKIDRPDSSNVQLDMVQYIFDKLLREDSSSIYNYDFFESSPKQRFEEKYPRLVNSLKRDGYTINDKEVVSLLPAELIEDNVEDELSRLLNKFKFNEAKGHLEQAIEIHSKGNWAGANGQFRTFMESLLKSISKHLDKDCNNVKEAIQWLSNPDMLETVLLSKQLNEVSFIKGLWGRLHPQGSHPGLSSEEDSTFRYHTLMVFARYLLKRIESRKR